MIWEEVGRKIFSHGDQERFASLSGDRNPLHMDPVAARRTQAGAQVVHGLHTLAWFLDAAARHAPGQVFTGVLKVRFEKFVALGEQARALVVQLDAAALRGEVRVGSSVAARIALRFTAPVAALGMICPHPDVPLIRADQPLDIALEEQEGRAGVLAPARPPAELAAVFPDAARALGPSRLSMMVGLTYLVGMVCPGLHSIFGGLTLSACAADNSLLAFRVTKVDSRFRAVTISVMGGGWMGIVNSFARHPPTVQPGMAALRGLVQRGEFAGRHALVIGGSRGLGELTAKLIAAGDGRATVTYATGESDAARVVQEIRQAGGACDTLRYDVRAAARPQLASLADVPTSLYYMATPPIFRRKLGLFDRALFDEFLAFYVTGFWQSCEALRACRPDLSVFYPSSVAVATRPAGMTEYAMAKMAGEILCADAASFVPPLRVTAHRLPRLATDQTASLQQVEMADASGTMLSQVRAVELGRATAWA